MTVFSFKRYALTVPVFLAIDIIRLGGIAGEFYRGQPDFILSLQVNWAAENQ